VHSIYLGRSPFYAAAICAFLFIPPVIHARYWKNERVCAGPQNVHIEPTSRLGGAAVFLAYVVAVTLALTLEHMPLRSEAVKKLFAGGSPIDHEYAILAP